MKYIVILGDGMADYPVEELEGKTPLSAAKKPNMDYIASKGVMGLVKTIPDGMNPGSDTANISVMGYDPELYYTGRSPLEAVSMGIELAPSDVAYRCNTVTMTETDIFEDAVMLDHSCDEIPTSESKLIIEEFNEIFKTDTLNIYPGVSYRHCLVLKDSEGGADTTPPHDILERGIREHLPKGQNSGLLISMTKKSWEVLKNHPANAARKERGLNKVSALWFWGEGRKPRLSSFYDRFKLSGSVVSAVDLIKGIGICLGLHSLDVEGATGNIHTNFTGKANAAIQELLSGKDFVYIHIEAPDECGHRHEIENKVKSIELIDQKILAPIMKAMAEAGEDYSILLVPDHATPLSLRTHTLDPVPFVIYRSNDEQQNSETSYCEEKAKGTGIFIAKGYTMMEKLIFNS